MEDKPTRNISIPLYLWIKEYKSINNVTSKSRLNHELTGWHTFEEVMTRFVKIYKVKCKSRQEVYKLFEKAIFKYNTAWRWVEYLDVVLEQNAVFDEHYKDYLDRRNKAKQEYDFL